MAGESLLTDDVRALIGKSGPEGAATVTNRLVRRAADVFGHGALPPLTAGQPVPAYVVEVLGTEAEPFAPPTLLPNDLLISNEIMLERPLLLGETLTLRTRLADISERLGGRFGHSLYLRSEVELVDPNGAVVARSVRTMMQYDARSAAEGPE